MSEIQSLLDTFNKKGFRAHFFQDAAAAKEHVMQLIEDAETIGMGGSRTLQETGIFDAVAKSGKTVYSTALERKKKNPDVNGAMRKAIFCDYYLTSTNALTKEGDLINIDATGNRVAPMFFGPKNTVVVCGTNKIADNAHKAIARIRNESVPKNAQMLGLAVPCAANGKCNEKKCQGPQRICRVTARIQYPTRTTDIHIILIDEKLGF